jgi:hypothetical protein
VGESMVIQIWENLPNAATRIDICFPPLEFLYSCRVVSRKNIGSDHPCHRLTSPRQNVEGRACSHRCRSERRRELQANPQPTPGLSSINQRGQTWQAVKITGIRAQRGNLPGGESSSSHRCRHHLHKDQCSMTRNS